MKKFFLITGVISLSGSILLLYKFNYSPEVISYHLLLIFFLHIFVFGLNILLSFIQNSFLRKTSLNSLNFIFLSFLTIFYITIIVSNSFWGKAITANIFINYLSSFDELITILPVEGWIFYSFLTLFSALLIITFWLTHPKPELLRSKYLKLKEKRLLITKILPVTAVITVLFFFFGNRILQEKRNIHFAGEPLLEFAFGQLWESESMEYIYDKERMKNALRDRACIDSVIMEKTPKSNRIIIVILLDALRKDFLPLYGYERKTSPFLDSLAQTGNLLHVRNTFSTSTTTLLGVAGLFGSKDWNNFSYAGLNIMKFLKKKKFTTYAFLTGQHRSWYGLANIYKNDCDYFYESTINPTKQNYDDLTTLEEFKKTKIKSNSFIYFHLLSTHNIGKKNSQFRKFTPDKIGAWTDKKIALINNYDNGILQADYVISQIFAKLSRDGLLNHTSVYIVSDHGELFGEEGRWSHSGSIQKDVLSIPLIIYDQDTSWYKNLETATIKDLAPTIADRLMYPIPSCWEGASLGSPPQNFSMIVNSGMQSEYPTGILSRQDSIIKLQIMDKAHQIKKTIVKECDTDEWRTLSNN